MAMWPFRRKEVEQRSLTSVPWAPMGGPEWGQGGPPPWAQGLDSETVLRCVPVFGAINFLANNIAAMAPGLGLYKLGKGDIAERQPTPSLFAAPSIHGTLFNWLHKSVISLAGGDAIGLITQRDYYGWPTMIEWLNPINVVTLDRAIEGPGSYVDPRWYWWGRPMDPADLLHIPFFCLPWRVRGLSPLAAFARTAGINLGAEHFAKEWFENGGVPPGTFKNTTQKVLPDDADEIARRYTRRLRTRQPLIYGMDWEYTPISISPNEAKFIECCIGSTAFSMADGTLRRADELVAGDEVQSFDGDRLVVGKVSHVAQMSPGPTIRVVSAAGHELVTSPNHPYLVSRRPRSPGGRYVGSLAGNSAWIKAADIRAGDYVRIALDWENGSEYLDPAMAWALGALVGDGGVSGPHIRFTSVEPALVDRLNRWAESYGGRLVRVGTTSDFDVQTGAGIGWGGASLLRREVAKFGILGKTAAEKVVPDAVMRGGPKAFAAFLAGYLDTDGTVAKEVPSVIWGSVSLQLLRGCQHLLAMLGIKSSVRLHTLAGPYSVRGIDCHRRDFWNLAVCGVGNIRRLAELLDVSHPIKAHRLRMWAGSAVRPHGVASDPNWVRVKSVEDSGLAITYGVTVSGTHTHVTNGLITHNTMQLTASHVAVIYGVPPHKIGGTIGDSFTYNTVEQESMDVLNFTFRPWLVRYEYAFSTCFPRGYYVQFNTSEFIRIDAKTRAEIDNISLGFQNPGWKDGDEVRASYNLAPKTIRPAPHLATMAAAGNGAGAQSPNGHMPPPGGLPTPGTSAAAAEPITRSRWITNGHNTFADGKVYTHG